MAPVFARATRCRGGVESSGKAQWDFPAILAAYDAVAGSPEVAARPRSPLSCREVYLAEPDAIGDDDLICDIAFPLGAQE
jgi:hypothetical protein